MLHYDLSHAGNDCQIKEHWYIVDYPKRCAIRLMEVSGYGGTDDVESTVYSKVDDDMPQSVKDWFNARGAD